MSDTGAVATYVDAETQVLGASNGVDYAHRVSGPSDAPPLVMPNRLVRRWSQVAAAAFLMSSATASGCET